MPSKDEGCGCMTPPPADQILRTEISCSWCHQMNDTRIEFCENCGHCAASPRRNCYCRQCTKAPTLSDFFPGENLLSFRRKEEEGDG